jgi:MFS family permease
MSDREFPMKTFSLPLMTAAAVAALCTLYMMSQFLRNSIGVIAPNLAADVGLSASEIGFLSSVYFLLFGIAQIPLGIALDRFGPKPCLLVSAGVAIAGCIVFALAQNVGGLVAGRSLMGIGTASFLMAPLAFYARRFPPRQFSTFAGLQLGIGTLGSLLATAPLAFSTAAVGWRITFFGIGGITLLIGALVWLIVRDEPPQPPRLEQRASLREDFAGLWEVICTPSIGRLFLLQLTNYPSYLLIVGLWGGPYLTHVYGFDLKGRGDILFIAALSQVIGSLFWGPMDRVFGRYKTPILIAVTITLFALVLLAGFGNPPLPVLIGLLAALGFSTGLSSLVLAQSKTLLPPSLIGRGFTLLNIGPMAGGFLMQSVSGTVIDMFPAANGTYALEGYRLVFGLQAGLMLVAFLAYLGSREGRLSH